MTLYLNVSLTAHSGPTSPSIPTMLKRLGCRRVGLQIPSYSSESLHGDTKMLWTFLEASGSCTVTSRE